jgi:hypothetical protein
LVKKKRDGTLRNADRNNARQDQRLAAGQPVKTVQDASHPEIQRLVKPDPGDFRIGQGRSVGKSDQWTATAGKRTSRRGGGNPWQKQNRQAVLHAECGMTSGRIQHVIHHSRNRGDRKGHRADLKISEKRRIRKGN